MEKKLVTKTLTRETFGLYGDVIDTQGPNKFPINHGNCMRYHDLADIDVIGPKAKTIISIVTGKPYELPLSVPMVERHPLGSQAFIPVTSYPFVIIVCEDDNGTPINPRAFLAVDGQGVNFKRNVWHGILTPIEGQSQFVVVDRAGEGNNLEEYFFDTPYIVSKS